MRQGVRQLRLRRPTQRPGWYGVGHGLEMDLDGHDFMDQRFYLGLYDQTLIGAIRAVVRHGDHCVDVGAHTGYVTLHLGRFVGADGHVLAFEPDPNAHAKLSRNVEHNQLAAVEILPWALGEEDGTARLFLSRQVGWSTCFPNQTARNTIERKIEVRVRSLDSLVRSGGIDLDPGRLSFVKLDCEGSEPFALAGMANTLAEADAILWIEVNRGSLEAAGSSPAAVESFLAASGFDLFEPRRRWSMTRGWWVELRRVKRIPTGQEIVNIAAAKQGARLAALRGRRLAVTGK